MKHSVDAENGQFTAKKPMTGKSDSRHSSQEVKLLVFMKKRFNFAMSTPTVLFIFYI